MKIYNSWEMPVEIEKITPSNSPEALASGHGGGRGPITAVGAGFNDGGGNDEGRTAFGDENERKRAREMAKTFTELWQEAPPFEVQEKNFGLILPVEPSVAYNMLKEVQDSDRNLILTDECEWYKKTEARIHIMSLPFTFSAQELIRSIAKLAHAHGKAPVSIVPLSEFSIDPAARKYGPFTESDSETRAIIETNLMFKLLRTVNGEEDSFPPGIPQDDMNRMLSLWENEFPEFYNEFPY